MTMAVENQQRHLGSMAFDHLPYTGGPQFTNPWDTTASSASSTHLFPPGLNPITRQHTASETNASMPYSSMPVSAPSIAAGNNLPLLPYGQDDSLRASQELLHTSRSYGNDQTYSTAPSASYAPTSAPYSTVGYTQSRGSFAVTPSSQAQTSQQPNPNERRLSHPSQSTSSFLGSPEDTQRERQHSLMEFSRGIAQAQQSRDNFGDALDASRGMLAMSQDATPRNIYAPRSSRGSSDGYGFPSTHSPSSSISSASYNPSYYGSTTSSITDYSESESLEPISSRTLPPPSGLMGANVPNAQSMMGQFNSKVASSTQKKHRCKICDKRFTRPSSLQTHMYSHTGEKPYQCEVEGCGRHFSVVSNLRRHRKVHKGDPGSQED
ncbi:MAG: hypothetical protein M1836_004146 [Candelina mexicana]|nr:MAG: hypothetical protein M1836_004146 [Candelina mexicana]